MDYSLLNEKKNTTLEYKNTACFSELLSYKYKKNISYIKYKPKITTTSNNSFYLSQIKSLPFFRCENEDVDSIISDGVVVTTSMPVLNMYAILTLVRYLEEKPERVQSFIKLINIEGLSPNTALVFCHILENDLPNIAGFGEHALFNKNHVINPICIKNYCAWLDQNINLGVPYNKAEDYILFGLWNFLSDKMTQEGANTTSIFKVPPINEWLYSSDPILTFAKEIDK